jgi:hypothetical protein
MIRRADIAPAEARKTGTTLNHGDRTVETRSPLVYP